MGSSLISYQQLLAASNGNTDLLNILQQMKAASENSTTVAGTTPVAGQIAGQPNPAAPVPPQATGIVSILGGAYVVQITNPGAQNAISALQAKQTAGNATSLTPLQPATTIFHQIRASTSPAFNVNSNTQTFGGNTGSTQTYWTLTGLGKGTWYVQFRSTYDGVNFNTWRNANGGSALGGLINQVTEENAGNANWALFTLPGNLIMGVGEGYLSDGEIFDLAEQVYSSGMFSIAGPNGFPPQTQGLYGMANCDVDLNTPNPLPPATGIPDYPVELVCKMAVYGGTTTTPSNATVFAIAFDPTNPNVTLYEDPAKTATWATMRLPGGASIAIGQGTNNDGDTIWTPSALSWLSSTRMMSICTLRKAPTSGNTFSGFNLNQLSGLTVEASLLDSSNGVIPCGMNWLAIAWETGADVLTVGGFPWLQIKLQGGHSIAIGAGQSTGGLPVTLPTGYTFENMLTIATPGGCPLSTGYSARGIQICAFDTTTPYLGYTDNVHQWGFSSPINWMVCCWV